MALVKGFLQSKPIREIPKYKYLVGVVVGLLMAFFLYALQYMTREMMRASSISKYDVWMLSDAEVSFYNLIFAFVAVIMGQSFCLEYIFNRPKHTFNTRPGRLQTIVNDQRFLNWNFLAWFTRVATMYGLMFCTAGNGDYYIMSLYPDFNYLFILMAIVLFLQTWNGLLLTFKMRAFKWMLVSMLIVTILSFGLSKVDIVDYKALNEMVINKRLDVQYNLRLPNSKVYQDKARRFSRLPAISLVTPKDSSSNQPLLFIDQTKINKEKLPLEILQMKEKLAYELQDFMPAFLKIDKEVPMSFVLEVRRELAFVDLHVINYLVIPSDAKYDKRYYRGWNRRFLSQFNTNYFAPEHNTYLERANAVSNRIDISISNAGYVIDGSFIPLDKLAVVLRKRVIENLDYGIVLNFKENVNFETYFNIISRINEVIYSLRDKDTFDAYSMDYRSFEDDYYYERPDGMKEFWMSITAKYPLRYLEIWDESGIRLPKKTQPDFALPKIK